MHYVVYQTQSRGVRQFVCRCFTLGQAEKAVDRCLASSLDAVIEVYYQGAPILVASGSYQDKEIAL